MQSARQVIEYSIPRSRLSKVMKLPACVEPRSRARAGVFALSQGNSDLVRCVHHMEHPDCPEGLGAGCIRAENMENDHDAPRRRWRTLRNAAQRRGRLLRRKWKVSAKGNAYLNTDVLNITVFQKMARLRRARIKDRAAVTTLFRLQVRRLQSGARSLFCALLSRRNSSTLTATVRLSS